MTLHRIIVIIMAIAMFAGCGDDDDDCPVCPPVGSSSYEGSVVVGSQGGVERWRGIQEITGTLEIVGLNPDDPIVDLSPFGDLVRVNRLRIQRTALADLHGLDNLVRQESLEKGDLNSETF